MCVHYRITSTEINGKKRRGSYISRATTPNSVKLDSLGGSFFSPSERFFGSELTPGSTPRVVERESSQDSNQLEGGPSGRVTSVRFNLGPLDSASNGIASGDNRKSSKFATRPVSRAIDRGLLSAAMALEESLDETDDNDASYLKLTADSLRANAGLSVKSSQSMYRGSVISWRQVSSRISRNYSQSGESRRSMPFLVRRQHLDSDDDDEDEDKDSVISDEEEATDGGTPGREEDKGGVSGPFSPTESETSVAHQMSVPKLDQPAANSTTSPVPPPSAKPAPPPTPPQPHTQQPPAPPAPPAPPRPQSESAGSSSSETGTGGGSKPPHPPAPGTATGNGAPPPPPPPPRRAPGGHPDSGRMNLLSSIATGKRLRPSTEKDGEEVSSPTKENNASAVNTPGKSAIVAGGSGGLGAAAAGKPRGPMSFLQELQSSSSKLKATPQVPTRKQAETAVIGESIMKLLSAVG
jgi:hypothetical protein